MMMTSEKFCLQWKEFQENVRHSYKDVRRTGEFSDVTLACEDGQQIRAHKVILSASSTFFRDLLSTNDHPQPLLLRGLKGSDLINVVDFIYHGEVEVEKENLYDFLAIGEKLKLKGLAKTPEHSAQQVQMQQLQQQQAIQQPVVQRALATLPNPSPNRSRVGQFTGETQYLEDMEEISMAGTIGNVEKEFRCRVCAKVSKFKGNMVRHMLVHTGERNYSCRFGCGACYKNSWNMKKHEHKCKNNPTPGGII